MAVRNMHVQEGFLIPIEGGSKTLEIRVGYRSIRHIQRDDVIVFNNSSVRKRVGDIRTYGSFEEMLATEDHSRIHPVASKEEILSTLRGIYDSTKEEFGVFVFELEPES